MLIPTAVVQASNFGQELAYVEFTSTVSFTSITDIVSAGSLSFDGSTRVCIEFSVAAAVSPSAGGQQTIIHLYDDTTDLGRIDQVGFGAATMVTPMYGRRFLTPAAGSHIYKIRGRTDGASGSVQAGAGGTDTQLPGYIRITRA